MLEVRCCESLFKTELSDIIDYCKECNCSKPWRTHDIIHGIGRGSRSIVVPVRDEGLDCVHVIISLHMFDSDRLRPGGSKYECCLMRYKYVLTDKCDSTFLVGLLISPAMMTSDGCKCSALVSNSALMKPSTKPSYTTSPVDGWTACFSSLTGCTYHHTNHHFFICARSSACIFGNAHDIASRRRQGR